jgi:hypothetical protein
MLNTALKQDKNSASWMDDVATKYANKVTEQKKTINWVEFWRLAYYEKLKELQSRSS